MFKLVIQDDEGKTTVVPLIRDEITIGRNEGNRLKTCLRSAMKQAQWVVYVDSGSTDDSVSFARFKAGV